MRAGVERQGSSKGFHALLRSCALLAALALLLGRSDAQTGYATEKHDELGLTCLVPLSYEPVPVPPDERWIVLAYAEKSKRAVAKDIRPELDVVWIDAIPDPPTPAGGEVGDTRTSRASAAGPVGSLERYVARRFPGWKLGERVRGRSIPPYEAHEALLIPGARDAHGIAGWVYAYVSDARTIAWVGLCSETELREHVKLWRGAAEGMRFFEPNDREQSSLEALYAKSDVLDVPFRIGVRKRLVRGWRAEDTRNYIVIYNTRDQPLVRKMRFDLEFLRAQYERYFPPVSPIRAVSTVRVCRDREEYLAYGGEEGTLGYWHANADELVLYDAAKARKGAVSDDSETFETLYHEAFHQFIHYSAGEIAPHPWFNEGHGDFFGGARVHGELRSIEANTRRLDAIQKAIRLQRWLPWEELVRKEERAFMERASLCYAQSWSIVYFLRTSPEVAQHPAWSKILPTYFEELKQAYVEERAALVDGRENDRVALWQAGRQARVRALDAAFEGVDFDAIEKAWLAFVTACKAPARK